MLPLKSTKRKLVLWSAVSLLSVVAYIVSMMLISSTNKTLAHIEGELGFELERENTLRDSETLLEETKGDRTLVETYFIKTDGVVAFINDLEDYAREEGLEPEISSVDIRPYEKDNKFFEVLDITLILRGKWDSMRAFLRLLDVLPVSAEVERISLDRGNSEDDDWSAIISLGALKKK